MPILKTLIATVPFADKKSYTAWTTRKTHRRGPDFNAIIVDTRPLNIVSNDGVF